MLKKYNIAAELLVLANAYFKKGQKKDAAKLALLAMDEADSEDVFMDLDSANSELDPTMAPEEPVEEVLSDEELEEVVQEVEDEPVEEISVEDVEDVAPEAKCTAEEEIPEAQGEDMCEECEQELPPVDAVLSKLKARKEILANLASLSGQTKARQATIQKFLKK